MDRYLSQCFATGKVQVFVGAGLSAGLYPTGDELRDRLLTERIYIDRREQTLADVIADKSVSLEDAAQFYELYQTPAELCRLIRDIYGEQKRPVDVHEKLWKLPNVRWIYTTNFDCLIEDAISRPKPRPEVITRGVDIPRIDRDRRVVFKPHGCARMTADRGGFVITRNDYLNYTHKRTLETLHTIYDLQMKAFLFLGYSLRDLNMRHIMTESKRIGGNIRSYAVLRNPNGPEARYWSELGVTLIESAAAAFIDSVLKSLPTEDSEWQEKIDARVDEKEEIANKAMIVITAAVKKDANLNVILDAGSTPLYLAKALAREIRNGNVNSSGLRIVTNSPLVMREFESVLPMRGEMPTPILIGGPFRHHTRAFTPDDESARQQLQTLRNGTQRTLAFIGATAIDSEGLKTKTEAEVHVKRQYIECSKEVYVLVDHSKVRDLGKDALLFSHWQKPAMRIITDRVSEVAQLANLVGAVI